MMVEEGRRTEGEELGQVGDWYCRESPEVGVEA